MKPQCIKGDDLMLFNGETGKSYAFATAHTLTITADTADTSSKDHGVWTGNEVAKISWEITSENLYTSEGFDNLFDSLINRKAIKVVFGLKQKGKADSTVADGDYSNWTPDYGAEVPENNNPAAPSDNTTTKNMYMGSAYITSLTANANTGENATYSVTLTGTGSIKRATGATVDAAWMTPTNTNTGK